MRSLKPLGRGWPYRLAGTALLASIAAAVGVSAAQAPPAPGQRWELDNVTIVDPRTGDLSADHAILIEGDHIARVGSAGELAAGDVRRVDGHGAFVTPGFNDMHAHPLNPGEPVDSRRLMLTEGITGFRQMSGSRELLAARRAGTLTPEGTPTLLALPGAILTPPLVAPNPEAVVAEVQGQRAQGADFIKIINLPPPAFFAGLAEANRLGLPYLGHLPPAVDVRQASDRGMRAIEHLGPREAILLGCSSEEGIIRREMAAEAGRPPAPPSIPPGPMIQGMPARVLANPMLATDAAAYARLRRVVDTFNAGRCRELAAQFAANQTWQEPTLIRVRTMEFGDDPQYVNNPNLRFVPPARVALWNSVAHDFTAATTREHRQTDEQLFALQLRLVKLFDQAGVPMLAGSDYGGGWLVPGYSLHQEFDLLAEAGLSPLRILQMTTINAARFLHRETEMGSIEPGRVADLVLLGGNPLASVQNLHRITGVVHNGRYYSAGELADIREAVARRTASSQAGPGAPDHGD